MAYLFMFSISRAIRCIKIGTLVLNKGLTYLLTVGPRLNLKNESMTKCSKTTNTGPRFVQVLKLVGNMVSALSTNETPANTSSAHKER